MPTDNESPLSGIPTPLRGLSFNLEASERRSSLTNLLSALLGNQPPLYLLLIVDNI